MADISALYPQPAKPQQNAPMNPLDALKMVAGAVQVQKARQEFVAHQAIGRAYQNNMNSDGTINLDAAQKQILTDPEAAYAAPEATSDILSQRGQVIANGTAQFQQQAAQNKFVMGMFGALADKPGGVSDNDLDNTAVTIARNTNIPSSLIATWRAGIPSDAEGRQTALTTIRNQSLGTAEAATPRVTGYGPDGTPITGTQGQFNYNAVGAGAQAQPGVVGLPPGFEERQKGQAQIDNALAGNLSSAAEGSPGRRAILGNLEQLVGNFTPGPGADWTKVAKAFVNRNVPLPKGWQFDPSSIASQEEFNKQSLQLAQQQFQAIGGTGTDAKFSSAFETNPNDTLSTLGNKGIIRLLKGNEDALQAKNRAWLDASGKNPNLSYRKFSSDFNAHFDPRVFQFKYIEPGERQAYYSKMSPDERKQFLYNLTFARKQGWVNYEDPTTQRPRITVGPQ